MALYKTHTMFNIFIGLPLLVAILFFLKIEHTSMLIFSSTYICGTLFMNPDITQISKIKLFSLRGLFSLPLRGYSFIFKHRGVSHSLIFGTLTRLVYLLAIAFIILFLLDKTSLLKEDLFSLIKNNKNYFLWGVGGIFLADILHLLLDAKKH